MIVDLNKSQPGPQRAGVDSYDFVLDVRIPSSSETVLREYEEYSDVGLRGRLGEFGVLDCSGWEIGKSWFVPLLGRSIAELDLNLDKPGESE